MTDTLAAPTITLATPTITLAPPTTTVDLAEVRQAVLSLADYAQRSYVVVPRRVLTLIGELVDLVEPSTVDVSLVD